MSYTSWIEAVKSVGLGEERKAGEVWRTAAGNWRSNNSNVVLEACERGLGIAYMPESTFTDSIKQAKLVPILTPFCIKGATSWIVYQNKQFMPLRARLAIDFLLEEFSGWLINNVFRLKV